MKFTFIRFMLISTFGITQWAPQALSQGAAVIMPLSKVAESADESVVFYIHNRLEGELVLNYQPKCDIDGAEVVGASCLTAFEVDWDTKIEDNKMVLAQGAKVKGQVKLTKKDVRFALFKPLFSPIAESSKKKNAVTFDFGYQPGYLFIVKPQKEHLEKIVFDTYVLNNTRHARMKIDISKLTVPQVVSVSAKLLNQDTKKLVRFVRLASDKIIDPKRGVLELDSEFTDAKDKSPICYQAFIEVSSSKDFYTIDSCK